MVLKSQLLVLKDTRHYPQVYLPRGFRLSRIATRDEIFSYVFIDEDRFICETDELLRVI